MRGPIQVLVRYGAVEDAFAFGTAHELLGSAANGAYCCGRPRHRLWLWCLLHVLVASPLCNRAHFIIVGNASLTLNVNELSVSVYGCVCVWVYVKYAGVGKRVLSPLRDTINDCNNK